MSTSTTRFVDSLSAPVDRASSRLLVTRASAACIVAGLAALIAKVLATMRFADHDMFHQMALAKVGLEQGALPRVDVFAFTPTISPSVHHEWGTGFVLHGLYTWFGADGIVALRVVVLACTLLAAAWTARRRGASWLLISVVAPLSLVLMAAGLAPFRAQLFTLFFLSVQLAMMDLDRDGRRWWVIPWLAMHVVWLNLHGGFVVGPALLALHWAERVVRTRQPHWHLIAAGAACIPLTLVNPYGMDYLTYMVSAVTMARPHISEWAPAWTKPAEFGVVLFAASVIVYAGLRRGWRTMPGFIVVLATLFESVLHLRHMSLFGVVGLAYLPGFLAGTPLDTLLLAQWRRRAGIVGGVFAAIAVVCLSTLPAPPWSLVLATGAQERSVNPPIPVGAAEYLERIGFAGNVMTPFNGSSYLSWKLGPRVKVSLDSRYEAAFEETMLEDSQIFYAARSGWQDVLSRFRPDLILVPTEAPVRERLASEGWYPAYSDPAFNVFSKATTLLAVETHDRDADSRFR